MMMKASGFITIILILLITVKLTAQGGFIKSFENFSNFSESLIDIIPVGDTILGVGLVQNDTVPYEFGLLLVAFDTLGNVLYYNNLFLTTPNSCFFQPPSKIINLINGNYAITGGVFSSPLKIYYLEFDKYCNKVNYYEYIDVEADFFSSNNIIQINSGFLMFGTINYLNDKKNDIFIKKIDNAGDEQWTRYYGESLHDEFFLSAKLISSNSILVGAERNYHSTPSDLADWYKSWFFVIDTLSYVSSSFETNESEKEVGPISMYLDSSKNITYVSQTYTHISNDDIRIFPLLVRRDSSFNVIWKRVIGDGTINAPNVFHQIIPDKYDSGWLMVGETAKFSSINAGYGEVCLWIQKVNQLGDSIWERKDTVYWSQQGTFQNSASGIFQTSTGSIYACGYNTQYLPSPNVRATLLKVNQHGCIQDNCNSVKSTEPEQIETIKIYPNPTTGVIEFGDLDFYKILIYNASNDLMYEGGKQRSIDLSTFTDGLYILVFYCNGNVSTQKIMKIDMN